MKKSTRLLSIVLAVLMVISMVPVAVFAETGVVTTLDELKTALTNGATEITVGADIDAAELTISKDVTIDLGGFTLTDAYIIITGKVTIKNGYIKNTNEPYPLVVQNSGVLTIEDVAIEASKSDRAIWVRSSGSLIFNSGSILATKGENNTKTNLIAAIYTDSNTNVTINGGTITVDTPDNKAVGIFGNYTNANVTVNGGKISTSGKNYSYGINVDGDITVTGGEIVTNEKGYGYSSGIRYGNNYALVTALGDVTVTGGTITTNGYSGYMVNVGRTYSSQDQTVTITGGTFSNNLSEVEKTTGGHKPPVLLWEGSASNVTATISDGDFSGFSEALLRGENTTLSISGGTFDVEVPEEFLAEDTKLVEKDGSFVVSDGSVAQIGDVKYVSLAAAINEAAEGDTVTLLDDIALSEGIVIDAEDKIILDLNGKTLTYNSTKQGEAMITNRGNLTINDSVGGGVINYNYTGAADPSYGVGNYTISNGGELTVNGGKITIANLSAHAKYPINNNSTTGDAVLVINGGHLYNYNTSAIRLFCNSTTYKNSVTINGGLIEGYSAIWMQNPGASTVNGSLTITGGEIKSTAKAYVNGTSDLKDVGSRIYCTIHGAGGAWDALSSVSITGGTFNENVDLYNAAPASVAVSDSAVFNGNIAVFELNGFGTVSNPYEIDSVEDLIKFRDSVNAGEGKYNNAHVILTADIDLSSVANWTPIGNVGYNSEYAPADSSKVFSGVFDGNNKVISNLKMSKTAGGADEEANLGLFGITGEGAVIKDLTITNVDIETDGRNVGALVAFAHKATIDNITVNGDIRIKGGNNVSGVCAMSRYYTASVTNITLKGNDGSTIVGNNIVGGIFAEIAPNGAAQTFKNLSVENVAISGVGGVGGLVGLQTGGTVENVSVKDVALTGRTDYQGNAMGRIRLGSVSGLMGGKNATIIGASVDNVTAKNLDGNAVVLPVIGANYDASSNATEAKIGDTYYATLTAALKAAKGGDTITLLEDITISEPINVTADLTIDGNGHTLIYTGTNRAIDVAKETNGADLTVKNLKVQAVNAERGINYNTNGTLILKNVEVTAGTYAVNLPAYSDEASVAVSDSKLTAAIALNVWGEDAVINVVDSTLTSVDKSAVENYSAIQLNNNGTDVANGTSVNVIGGELIAQDDSFVASNWSETGKISISNSTKIVMDTTGATVRTMVAIAAGYGFVSLQDAIDWVEENSSSAPIELLHDIELSESVNVTGTITLDLNGKTIAGTDTATKSFGLINVLPGADLTVKDSVGGGKITLEATNDRDWNAYSSVISNQRGKLTVESGTIEHLGGTDMAYGIDNLTNGKGTYAETVINGGTIKSPYRAIRQFLNGVEAQNILTVNGGTIEGANKSIWMQDPSKNANTGTLTVTENASLKGDVYLYVTPGSTEWPVEVSIAAAAVDGEVITGNVPAGYGLANVNGTYSVCTGEAKIGDIYYDTVEAAVAAAQAGDTIELIANAEIENKINVLADLIIDGNGYTLTYTGSDRAIDVTKETNGADLTVKDLTVDCTASYCQRGINYNTTGTLTLDGVTVKGTNVTYAVNMPAYSDGATVEIKDSDISGCIALNVWGKNVAITANNTVFTSIDKTDAEGYVAIKLNNDVTNVADGTVITVNGGKIVAKDENGAPSTATDNATATGKIIVSDTTEVIGEHRAAVAIVKYIGYNEFYSCYSLQEAIEQAENDPTATVMLLRDLEANEIITIEGAVTIDGNEKTLTSTAGRAINVDTTAEVTIKNLTIVGGEGCQRGINIINKPGTTNLEKVKISGISYYAVNVATSAGAATVNIKDSDLTGYSALAIYGKGTTVKVTGSDLKGVNTYENNAQYPHSNDYGAIDVAADNVTVTTEGGTITAVTGGDEWSAYQRILNINARVEEIGGIVLDSELVLEGERAEYLCNFSSQGTLSVRDDYADGIVAEGYTTKDADNGLVNVIYLPELPTATVTELENDDLTFALKFKADEATDEQLDFYGEWYADFVLTVNKDVTFNADGSADGYLSGQYDSHADAWLNVPFEDVTLKADESFRIMAYAAEEFNKPEFKLTYNDVYNYVKEFNCGVFFTDEFLANNQDLVVTLELRMYNPDDESESYIIGKAREYTAPEVDLVAEVDGVQYSSIQRAFDYAENGSTITVLKDHTIEKVAVLAAGQTVTLDLNGKTLKAADGIIPMIRVNGNLTVTGEGQMTCASEDAYCFIVGQNVDGNLTKGTLTIKNGTFHAATTVASVTAGTLNVEGGHFSVAPYEGSYAYVLNCIDANYNNGNAEIVVTGGTFANFDPNNNASEGNGTDYVPFGYTSTAKENGTWTVEEGIASYDFPTATVTELDKDDLTFALTFKADEVTDEQLAYFGDWYADFELTLNKDAVFNASDNNADGHLAGEYGSYGWINVPFDAVEMKANESLKIMAYAAELLNQPGLKFTYREVYDLVQTFNCGVFFSDEYLAENPDLEVTLELRMYNPADESESYVIGETYEFEAPIIPVGDAVCVNTNTNKQYDTVAKGLADAKAGETVQLLKNCSEGYVLVTPGVTLDLNGFELTADYVIGFSGSNVIDSVETATDVPGKLIVKKDNVVLDKNNAQMSVYDGEGYIFATMAASIDDDEPGQITFVTVFGSANNTRIPAFAAIANEEIDDTLDVKVRVSWVDDGGTYVATQDYTYTEETMKIVFDSYVPNPATNKGTFGRNFYAKFTSASFEGMTPNIAVVVTSSTGVEYVTASYTLEF